MNRPPALPGVTLTPSDLNALSCSGPFAKVTVAE